MCTFQILYGDNNNKLKLFYLIGYSYNDLIMMKVKK